jgi:UDP-N-acetylmuramate: L-alanyl-gamma-D-glutamyl-meso-diaminopimelate ligase
MLDPEKNILPEDVKEIYMMGICGAGMSALAGILSNMGFKVRGSDHDAFPPVSELLRSLNIPFLKGYSPTNLRESLDLVVIGNVIRRDNPEILEISKRGLPYLSFPQTIKELLLKERKSLVIAGTHGKTTTTTLVALILRKAGFASGLICGGISKNTGLNFMVPSDEFFVVEGDEYDSAFFDKEAKFLHYNPFAVLITGIEFDHADIYRSLDQIVLSFRKLISLIPENGMLVYNRENSIAVWEARRYAGKKVSYGFSHDADFYIKRFWYDKETTYFEVYRGKNRYGIFSTPLYGEHNLSNFVGAISLCDQLGIKPQAIEEAIQEFKGVKRRLDHIGEKKGILIIDDFAHHPTAVKETIKAVKKRFPKRRLFAVFEPRSNSSRRSVFQKAYSLVFDRADVVMIPEPKRMELIPEKERFSSFQLVQDLRIRGIEAYYCPDTELLLSRLIDKVCSGDIVLFMSNGIFDHLPERLFSAL